MESKQPQVSKNSYSSLFMAALFLLVASQAVESIQTPAADFIRGVAIGLSIVCSVTGLVLYTRSNRKE